MVLLSLNDNCKLSNSRFGVPFQYPFTIGKHTLNIAMHGDKYELRVDGMSFSHMYALNRARGAFGEEAGYSHNWYDDTYNESSKSNIDRDPYGEKPYEEKP